MELPNTVKSKHGSGSVEDARTRLLDSAEILFAEKGFERTSIRDITTAARCNVASVNYYFKSKDNLYREVYIRQIRHVREYRSTGIEQTMSGQATILEDLIRTFALTFLEPLFTAQSGQILIKLIIREMQVPRLPKELFVQEMIQPLQEQLGKAIQTLCSGIEMESVLLSIRAMVGCLLYYLQMSEQHRTNSNLPEPPPREAMIEHFVRFASGGIRAFIPRAGIA